MIRLISEYFGLFGGVVALPYFISPESMLICLTVLFAVLMFFIIRDIWDYCFPLQGK